MAGPVDGLEATIAERRGARERERRRSRRRRILLWGARTLMLVVVFFVGYLIGRAVEEAPRPGGTQTRVQTLEPNTLPPVTRTVTVTPGEP
jgi:predicted nucleic acid-binding Zn ribbon protein